MKTIAIFFFIILFATTIYSQHLSKVYVLSEGGFSPNSSRLSSLDVPTNTFRQNIFNPGNIGLYPDGLILHEDYLYILEQGGFGGSGKIYKADTNGTVLNSASVGTNPYSLAISNSKIYVTNGPAGNVSVLNLSDFSLIKNITVGAYPQEILAVGNKVFVANTSMWGGASDSTVSVINTDIDSVVAKITVKKDPSSLAISNDGSLLIGCPGDQNNGKIFKVSISNYSILDTYNLPTDGFGKDISVDKRSNALYFIANSNNIVRFDLNSRTSSVVINSVFPANHFYGYSYDYTNNKHYVLDARDFTVTGRLHVYDSLGASQGPHTTGIAPRRVLLKYNFVPTKVPNEVTSISSYTLEQNYPNPFNPSTIISWQLPAAGHVTLKIFDLLGNEIVTLIDEQQSEGSYKVGFNNNSGPNDLPSGVYFYRMEVSSSNSTVFSSTKKLMLMK